MNCKAVPQSHDSHTASQQTSIGETDNASAGHDAPPPCQLAQRSKLNPHVVLVLLLVVVLFNNFQKSVEC